MKPFKKVAIATLAASVAGSALIAVLPATAQEGPADGNGGPGFMMPGGFGGHGGPGGRFMARMMFEHLDTNGDGAISQEEVDKVRADEFTAADKDANGEISLEEFKAAFMERSKPMQVRAFQFLDRDGDGTVTQEEFKTVSDRLFNRLDRDGNGVVERMRGGPGPDGKDGNDGGKRDRDGRRDGGRGPMMGGPMMGQGGPGGHGMMFLATFDRDGDGKVTRDEFEEIRGELFASADKDGSGSFTLEDFSAIWATVSQDRVVRMFQREDRDGSPGLTKEEAGARLGTFVEQHDRNRDGVVTKADMKHGHRKDGERGGWRHRDRGPDDSEQGGANRN